jgi:hypothetical protein
LAARRASRQSGLAEVDYASVDRAPMRHDNVKHLVTIGGPTDIAVGSIAAPQLSAPRPARATVADDETKQLMARRARM